jgi:hypothetical protein
LREREIEREIERERERERMREKDNLSLVRPALSVASKKVCIFSRKVCEENCSCKNVKPDLRKNNFYFYLQEVKFMQVQLPPISFNWIQTTILSLSLSLTPQMHPCISPISKKIPKMYSLPETSHFANSVNLLFFTYPRTLENEVFMKKRLRLILSGLTVDYLNCSLSLSRSLEILRESRKSVLYQQLKGQ